MVDLKDLATKNMQEEKKKQRKEEKEKQQKEEKEKAKVDHLRCTSKPQLCALVLI